MSEEAQLEQPEVKPEEKIEPEVKLTKHFKAKDQEGEVQVGLWSDGKVSFCHTKEELDQTSCSTSECLDDPEKCYREAKDLFNKFGLKVEEIDMVEADKGEAPSEGSV